MPRHSFLLLGLHQKSPCATMSRSALEGARRHIVRNLPCHPSPPPSKKKRANGKSPLPHHPGEGSPQTPPNAHHLAPGCARGHGGAGAGGGDRRGLPGGADHLGAAAAGVQGGALLSGGLGGLGVWGFAGGGGMGGVGCGEIGRLGDLGGLGLGVGDWGGNKKGNYDLLLQGVGVLGLESAK